MSARLTLHALLCSGREQDCKFLDTAYEAVKREVLREAAEKIRASTQDARKVERDRFKFTDFESQLQYEAAMAAADLIDPDKEN